MININSQLDETDEEILIRDESGQFRILHEGSLKSLEKAGTRPLAAPMLKTSKTLIDTGLEEPMLQPPPPVVMSKTASFYFHPEDEEEVAQFKTIKDATTAKQYSIEKIVNKAIADHQLDISEQQKARLKNIIFSFLRDRRTLVDFTEVLQRTDIEGGMNFPEDKAEKIINFIKEIKEKIELEKGLVVDQAEIKGQIPSAQLIKELKQIPKIEKPEPTAVLPEKSPAALPIKPVFQKPPVRNIFKRPVKKGKMSDVKKDYKLVGPIEELAGLDLATFRRLGASVDERIQKIVKRVEGLAQESLTRKSAGLKAWRTCPLYRMYLAVGQAGMEHNLPVLQIIEQYQSSGKEILSLEEFEAVSDINRQLRF